MGLGSRCYLEAIKALSPTLPTGGGADPKLLGQEQMKSGAQGQAEAEPGREAEEGTEEEAEGG